MVLYEWDIAKAKSNFRKHRVSFQDAIRVFDDPYAVLIQDRIEHGEMRWQVIGLIDHTFLLLVVHTIRDTGHDQVVRLLSARPVTREERGYYGENNS